MPANNASGKMSPWLIRKAATPAESEKQHEDRLVGYVFPVSKTEERRCNECHRDDEQDEQAHQAGSWLGENRFDPVA
jgi:hypothetical protein